MSTHRCLPLILGCLLAASAAAAPADEARPADETKPADEAKPAGEATPVDETRPGEQVERHLSDDQPFRQWSQDPDQLDSERGDRLEVRKVPGLRPLGT